ncbi:MAG: class I SAM-dependent methyltransferase [Saccharofermentans sp.]|nr:class I SAM-dependent methyltransferase [Saccharofermentans sp.]
MQKTKMFKILIRVLLPVCSFLLAFIFPINLFIKIALGFTLALISTLLLHMVLKTSKLRYTSYKIMSWLFYKNSHGLNYCPCCDNHFDSFLDLELYNNPIYNPAIFKGINQKVSCPLCNSAPRHRIIATWANMNIEKLKSSKVLLFAPEISLMLWFDRNKCSVTTADLIDPIADKKIDLTSIDFKDNSYDYIFCNHVLEHVNDYKKALSELYRILTADGTLIISFPIDDTLEVTIEKPTTSNEERKQLFGQIDHLRIFGNDSIQILNNAGFEVDIMDTSDKNICPDTAPAKYDSNQIFICTKRA